MIASNVNYGLISNLIFGVKIIVGMLVKPTGTESPYGSVLPYDCSYYGVQKSGDPQCQYHT